MYDFQNKLNSLTESSVWVFTKQETSFDDAFKAVKLLSEIPDKENVNIEEYFAKNSSNYDICTGNHRMLTTTQLYGLLTKTPPYKRGGVYKNEKATEIFELLNKCPIGSKEYNTIKTEQILKVKIKAIIDTAGNNENWNILPIIFIYKVLKTLKEQHQINAISLDMLYTYVMTCEDYSKVEETVSFIKNSSPATDYVNTYKGRSRFKPLIEKNIKLFTINQNTIAINEDFDDYFNEIFMERFDIDELNIQLSRDVDYTYFLTTLQNFDVNLIDVPSGQPASQQQVIKKKKTKKVVTADDGSVEDDDVDYVLKVDRVKEFNINPAAGKDADKIKPTISSGSIAKRYSKNPIIGKIAIQKANYLCENMNDHSTFISNTTKKQYMEAHHLIPISYQEEMWNRFGVNIDCVENIVSLCPNCHRAIHYAIKGHKSEIISKMYVLKKQELKRIGIDLSLEEVMELY